MTSLSKIICDKFNVKAEAYAPHKEKYQYIINLLGYDKVKNCLPFSLEEIKKALKTDKYLNNLPIKTWDNAGGWEQRGADMIRIGSRLQNLLLSRGINAYSPASCVCILKECARMYAEENKGE